MWFDQNVGSRFANCGNYREKGSHRRYKIIWTLRTDCSEENSASFLIKRSISSDNDDDYVILDKNYAEEAQKPKWKFYNFNKILLRYFKRNSFRTKFIIVRTVTFLLVFLSNSFIYYQLIAPARNPTTISCPIPVELQARVKKLASAIS